MIEIITLLLVVATLGLLLVQYGGLPNISLKPKRRIILDSCALIDGRIVELVRTGFVTDEIVVPKFILRELQMLADGNDSHKRERARFGLEVVVQLQDLTTIRLDDTKYTSVRAIDDKLVLLARELKAALCTTDFNLNKVATVEGVKVLNVNELSHALRPVILPGEKQVIKIVQKGNNKNQGVGYQEDGTMVVVEGGAKYIGKSVAVVVEHMLQTVAGKMVFAKLQNVDRDSVVSSINTTASQPVPDIPKPNTGIIKTARLKQKLSSDQLEQTLLHQVNTKSHDRRLPALRKRQTQSKRSAPIQ